MKNGRRKAMAVWSRVCSVGARMCGACLLIGQRVEVGRLLCWLPIGGRAALVPCYCRNVWHGRQWRIASTLWLPIGRNGQLQGVGE